VGKEQVVGDVAQLAWQDTWRQHVVLLGSVVKAEAHVVHDYGLTMSKK
jgi:hypothetical protein